MRDFDSFIRDCELIDLPLSNARFTWSNLQENRVCCRLDRFENMWLEHRSFKEFFKGWWENGRVHGWEGFKFMRKLRGVKDNLKVWKREVFGDIGAVKAGLIRDIEELDVKEAGEGLSGALRDRRSMLKVKLEEIVFREQILWGQRAKLKWARVGDTNSRFYHRVASRKRKKSFIKNLVVDQNEVVCKEELIVKEIFNFYSNLYFDGGVDRPGIIGINWAPVEVMTADWLERPFEEDEIRQAVFECERDKAPGPDGFSMAVFKIVGILRLRVVLGETISLAQGAFVQGRQILDVVLVANEVVEEYRGLRNDGVVFKVDFEKAYDHVDWGFVDFVLERKEFGVRWRKWIWGCLSSCNMSVIVNGKARDSFLASRGLRQGDPLSPFLFILVTDVLGRIIDLAKDKGVIEGFVVGRDRIEVTHLQFADDTIFFSSKEENKVGCLLQVLRIFEIVSGLKVNLSKSSVVGINLNDSYVRRVADMLGCSIESFPIKYLGLPLGGDPRLAPFWEPVLVKIGKCLEGWKRALLSKGGRYILVQSVLGSVPIYFLSIFKIPISIARKIEKLMRDFLWEGCGEGTGFHLVRWDTVSLPKEKGGLAIGNIVARNIALLGKWLWRFSIESDSLWCSVIKSKYGVQPNGRDSNVVTRGVFSYKSLFDKLIDNPSISLFLYHKKIWKVDVPHKVKFFMWSLTQKGVTTNDIFQRRRPNYSLCPQWCVMYKRNLEEADHLFLHCRWLVYYGSGYSAYVMSSGLLRGTVFRCFLFGL
ncbi:uncharacterized protein LOC114318966 [Camellia sinensis]|uniref:uncharacterized protein LOC114318966 n=1 Tax=Camellia sinensis TaxID=4442 RepID=UPI00103564B6|nr:uncharacterized protein LOC114318966 [Camellia sinensis]